VTYEAEDGASEAFGLRSGRIGKVASNLELGGTFASDDHATTGHQLMGINARARLGASTTLLGEFARAENASGPDGTARTELRHRSDPSKPGVRHPE
jgi:hypothetical protein